MRVSKKSRVIRWGYWGNPPRQTTLCKLFWRVFVLNTVLAVLVAVVVAALGVLIVTKTREFLIAMGIIAAAIGAIAGATWADNRMKSRARSRRQREWDEPIPDGLFIASLKSVKGKICPIITIE